MRSRLLAADLLCCNGQGAGRRDNSVGWIHSSTAIVIGAPRAVLNNMQ